jgi:predicted transcriptional regulator
VSILASVKSPEQLTPAEYEIIQILWSRASSLSVSHVLEVLRRKKLVAYTTVMTLMDKMARKGSLKRVKKGKAYYYRPHVERSGVLSFLLQEFTDQYFDGEEEKLTTFVQKRKSQSHSRQAAAGSSPATIENRVKTSRSGHPPSRAVRESSDVLEDMDVCLL